MSLYAKGRKLRGVPCFRTILRDPTVKDAELRLLLLLKSKAKHGEVTVNQKTMAKSLKWGLRTVQRHSRGLERKRLIRVAPNVCRGLTDISTYMLDDEFYAKHLFKKKVPARYAKNGVGVPYGTTHKGAPTLHEVPPNVIPLTYSKLKRKANA